jgi:hypothetical protein
MRIDNMLAGCVPIRVAALNVVAQNGFAIIRIRFAYVDASVVILDCNVVARRLCPGHVEFLRKIPQ